jgi:hypothetical protein
MPSASALRASLFGGPPTAAAVRARMDGETPEQPVEAPTPPPSPAEVLAATPALVRLCESYQRAQAEMTHRGRRQRLGIFVLVSAISIGALLLRNSGTLTASLVSDLVLAVAGASAVSVGLLALLWFRDDRRLRGIQGERLLRAIQSNCSLPAERITAYRRSTEPVAGFFECYATWRSTYSSGPGGGLMKALRHTRA